MSDKTEDFNCHEEALESFRSHLLNELSQRCNRNPKYSLRAFARFLKIDPGTLSKILNKKHFPGPRLIERLGQNLLMNPVEIENYKFLSPKLSQIKKKSIPKFLQLKDDQFKYISKWYFMAILELLELNNFRNDYQWMAIKLGISLYEVRDAFVVLERIGILKLENENWVDLSNGKLTCLGQLETSAGMRSLQKEILNKAIDALEDISIEKRSQTSMTMAINKKEVPLVKKLIAEFRRNMSGYLNENSCKDEVYHLSISFYPVTVNLESE